jgi:phosphatidylglycerol lysyltransferase
MEALLVKYGYALLFLGVAVEGEAFLLAAAFLAHRGLFHLCAVILVAVAANSVADQLYYRVARGRGKGWLERRHGARAGYARVMELASRHGGWLLLGSRFAYGFRILIPAACGALGMRPVVFTLLDLAAGAAWALVVGLLGYYSGVATASALTSLRRFELWLAAAVALALAAVLGARQIRRVMRPRELGMADLHGLVPFVIGLMGALNLISAIWPRHSRGLIALETWLPLEVRLRSRPLMLFAGLALLQVTRNLARRKALAWWVAVVALGVSLVSHVSRGFDLHHSLVAGVLLAYLVHFRRRFQARSDPGSLRRALLMFPVLAGLVLVYGDVGLHHLHGQFAWEPGETPLREAFRSGIFVLEPEAEPQTLLAERFLGSLQIAGWLARLYMLVLLLRPVILRSRQEAPPEAVARTFQAHGRHSLAAFAVQPDKNHLSVAGGEGLVAYAVRGAIALACGDPLAPPELFEPAVRDFLAFCRTNGWTPCIYEAAEEGLPVYRALGLRVLKIAEEAVLDLPRFSLAGGRRASLRSMVHKTMKMGLAVRRYEPAARAEPALDEQLERISEEWLEDKRLGEMGFSLGRFSLEGLAGGPVFVCEKEGQVQAFCSWLPYGGGQAVVLDLMRKRRDAVSGTMDLLLAEALRPSRPKVAVRPAWPTRPWPTWAGLTARSIGEWRFCSSV